MGNCISDNRVSPSDYSIFDLPLEIHLHIGSFMTQQSLMNMITTSKYFHKCIKSLPYEEVRDEKQLIEALKEKRFRDINCSKNINITKYRLYRENRLREVKIHPNFIKDVIINACDIGDINFILKYRLSKQKDRDMYTRCMKGILGSIVNWDLFIKVEEMLRNLYFPIKYDSYISCKTGMDICFDGYIQNLKEERSIQNLGFKFIHNLWFDLWKLDENKDYMPFYQFIIEILKFAKPPYGLIKQLDKFFRPPNFIFLLDSRRAQNENEINYLIVKTMDTLEKYREGFPALYLESADYDIIEWILFQTKTEEHIAILAKYIKKRAANLLLQNRMNFVAEYNPELIKSFVKYFDDDMIMICELLSILCQQLKFEKATMVWETTTLFIDPCKIMAMIKIPNKLTMKYLIERGGSVEGVRAYKIKNEA